MVVLEGFLRLLIQRKLVESETRPRVLFGSSLITAWPTISPISVKVRHARQYFKMSLLYAKICAQLNAGVKYSYCLNSPVAIVQPIPSPFCKE